MTRISKILAGLSALALSGGALMLTNSTTAQADTAGYEVVASTETEVEAGTGVDPVEAQCSSGKKVVGGGWSQGSSDLGNRLDIVEDQDAGPTAWSVSFVRHATVDRNVAVFAICINES